MSVCANLKAYNVLLQSFVFMNIFFVFHIVDEAVGMIIRNEHEFIYITKYEKIPTLNSSNINKNIQLKNQIDKSYYCNSSTIFTC